MNQEKIGKFIQSCRKEKKLTQEDLANKLGITKNAVSKWERGISMMDMSLLIPVCDILDISITELLNGEKINNEDLKEQTEKAIKNTINFTDKKIRKNRIKNICLTTLIIFVICISCFFGYKFYLFNKYTLDRPSNVDKIIKGLSNSSEVKIYKRTIDEDEYFYADNFKIRNDFEGFVMAEKLSEAEPDIYRNGDVAITFSNDLSSFQLIDTFKAEDVDFYGDDTFGMKSKFASSDRKFFLLKNDINNDIDLYKFASQYYYIENNIFMDKRTLMENYSFNLFCSIGLPIVEEIIYINGDYLGYILKGASPDKNVIEVSFIRNDKRYGFITNDNRFSDMDYLKDILGTVEFYD